MTNESPPSPPDWWSEQARQEYERYLDELEKREPWWKSLDECMNKPLPNGSRNIPTTQEET